MSLPALAIIIPQGTQRVLAKRGRVPPPGNKCSFYLLIHAPNIDSRRPGHPTCRQQLRPAPLSGTENRWTTWTRETTWWSRSLEVGEGGDHRRILGIKRKFHYASLYMSGGQVGGLDLWLNGA